MTSSTAEGQSQAAEPPIQVLRQRVHQLVDTVHTTQRHCDELSRQDAAGRSQQQALADQLKALTQDRDQLSTERDALAASQQELGSQRNGLQAERDALQAERDALSNQLQTLSTQRDGLQQERDRLVAERDVLQVERDSLQEDKSHLETDRQQLRAALEHVFPYETYREKRSDLSQHNDGQLIDHFVRQVINENTDLRHAPMRQRLEGCQKENRKLHKGNALIRQELSKAQIQMELLKELIAASKPKHQAKAGESSLA